MRRCANCHFEIPEDDAMRPFAGNAKGEPLCLHCINAAAGTEVRIQNKTLMRDLEDVLKHPLVDS